LRCNTDCTLYEYDLMIKICEYCGGEYAPNLHATSVQKYCNRKCKDKAAFHRDKAAGKIRIRKGGYNRTTYIKCWLKAKEKDHTTAPCYLCGKRLDVDDDWVLDHRHPLSKLETREQVVDSGNLSVCCKECNIRKGSTPYDEFIKKDASRKV
jgi:5-methylcytosine-specific restriction endonuclease McrA